MLVILEATDVRADIDGNGFFPLDVSVDCCPTVRRSGSATKTFLFEVRTLDAESATALAEVFRTAAAEANLQGSAEDVPIIFRSANADAFADGTRETDEAAF